MEASKALTPQSDKLKTFGDMLEARKATFAKILPRHMNPERMIKVALLAMSRQPLLLQCTSASIIKSMLIAAQLGLEPDGVLGSAYLVPFRNKKTGQMEAQLIPGYRGLIDLARRSGQIVRIEARAVHEKDDFEFSYGLEQKLNHRPHWPDDPGAMIGVFALAELRDGSRQVEVMSRSEVDKIKARSKAQEGPWQTDYEEMARKTVVRRLVKYLPLSVELATALEVDNRAEGEGETLDLIALPTGDIPEALPEPALTKTEELQEKLRKPRSDRGTTRGPKAGDSEKPEASLTTTQMEVPTTPTSALDPEEIAEIFQVAGQAGKSILEICQKYEVSSIEEMDRATGNACLGWLMDLVAEKQA